MKRSIWLFLFSIAIVISACNKTEQDNQKKSVAASQSFALKVINWGPQSAKLGANPNIQPDGSIGFWIEVAGTEGLGEAQVIFSGQPAKLTVIQDRLITAAVDADQFSLLGDREISIKQVETGKLFPVGMFKITAQ